jgi:hypothetical protein
MLTVLNASNWQSAVQQAIDELPDDLRQNVAECQADEHSFIISIVTRPLCTSYGDQGAFQIHLKYWESFRDRGWPAEHEELYQPGGYFAHRLTWPVIAISSEVTGVEDEFFPERDGICNFKRRIQLAVLEEISRADECGPFGEDRKGRIIRQDGTPVLAWQFNR